MAEPVLTPAPVASTATAPLTSRIERAGRRLLHDRIALTGIAVLVLSLVAVPVLLQFGVSFVVLLAVVSIGFGLYALPVIVAWQRDAVHVAPIAVVTVATGWTVLGWIAAFVWALFDRTRAEEARRAAIG
jgi:hypothetical protein